jgi:hypothetical protein
VKKPAVTEEGSVSIVYEGRTFEGTWKLEGRRAMPMLWVLFNGEKKAATLKGSTPQNLAKILLRELVTEGLRRGELK